MKRIISAIVLATSSMVAFAAPVKIFEDREDQWFVHTETFRRIDGGVMVIVTNVDKTVNEAERMGIGLKTSACQVGAGSLYITELPIMDWNEFAVFTKNGVTVGDRLAAMLCNFHRSASKTI